MSIELDLTTLPPEMSLHEADDFTGFAVRAKAEVSTFVTPDLPAEVARPYARDPEWREKFEAMLAHAERKGWTRADGAVEAHIEWKE